MNADQGSQYKGAGWITTFPKVGIKISMGGWSRYLDNIFIEKTVVALEARGRLSA